MKENSKLNIKKYILIGIIAVIILCLAAGGIYAGIVARKIASDIQVNASVDINDTESKSENSQQEDTQQPLKVNILGVGDNLIHDTIYNQAKQRANNNGYDFEFAYKNIEKFISSADIASLNQETIMDKTKEPSNYPCFNSPTEVGDRMVDIGFDVINHATNHVYDKLESGIVSTLDYWATKPEIKVVGVYKNKEDADNIRIIEKNGIKFAFLGMTEHTNGINIRKDSPVVLFHPQDEVVIKSRIEKAKAMADVVVVNVHWGVEYTHKQNEFQISTAKKMAEWGADIIFGHHPHVIQPVEKIQCSDGRTAVVCYSLGNFISAQDRAARMLGGTLSVDVIKDVKNNNKIVLDNIKFIPVVTHYDAGFRNIRVYKLSDYTPELASKHGVKAKSPEFSYDYLKDTVKKVINEEFLEKEDAAE